VSARGETSAPLAGLRILEVGHILAGPYATMLLADLGAEVGKIESRSGDLARQVGPYAIGVLGYPPRSSTSRRRFTLVASLRGIAPTSSTVFGTL